MTAHSPRKPVLGNQALMSLADSCQETRVLLLTRLGHNEQARRLAQVMSVLVDHLWPHQDGLGAAEDGE